MAYIQSIAWVTCIYLLILNRLLKSTISDSDGTKRREVVKKVIAFMTLGNTNPKQ